MRRLKFCKNCEARVYPEWRLFLCKDCRRAVRWAFIGGGFICGIVIKLLEHIR